MEQTLTLTAFYSGWARYQQNLVAMIAPLSSEQLDFRPSPNHWSIGMIAQHIIGNRVWWFQVWMEMGKPNLAPMEHWDPQDKEWQGIISTSELVAGLEGTWQMIEDALAHWTPDDLEYIVPQPAALNDEDRAMFSDLTRRWIIWHVLEHEIHHGGELSFALGMYGLAGIYG